MPSAVCCLHGEKTVAADRHVQLAAGLHQGARPKVGSRLLFPGHDPALVAIASQGIGGRPLEVGTKTCGIHVGQVVGPDLLGHEGVLRPRHGGIDKLFHGSRLRRS